MNNVSANTQNYVNNSPWKNGAIGSGRSKIATFEHIDYNDILAKNKKHSMFCLNKPMQQIWKQNL